MEIRLATINDMEEVRTIDTNIPYISSLLLMSDIQAGRLYIGVEADKIVSTCAAVPEPYYNYTAMKRLYVDPNCRGKGYAQQMIEHISNQYNEEKIGATPWVTNGAMRHTLEKEGFTLEYIFNEKWCFYSKQV